MRLNLRRPDSAVFWTANETDQHSQDNKPYLLDPFMNRQVAWDSEFYISIALAGYDNPNVRVARNPRTGETVPLNYAFFPLYPGVMRVAMIPLYPLNLTPIAASALGGVVVSLLGTLAGMLALWDLTREYLEEAGALRAIFYLLVFPTGFFLAQVYTEGLFIGIAFWVLALSRRKQWLWASLLSGLAPWTRAQGAALVLPLVVAWLQAIDWKRPPREQFTWKLAAQGGLALAPLISYYAWRTSLFGQRWEFVQTFFFNRSLLAWGTSIGSWSDALKYAADHNSQALVYYSLELLTLALATVASLALLRRYPGAALFSLAVVIFSAFSGVAQSMSRYVLVAPSLYIFLSRLGRNAAFDRAWTLASLLLMGMSAMLYSFDMWVG